MAKFDKAIKLLEQERFRIIGKTVSQYVDKHQNVTWAVNMESVKEIQDAIDILKKHQPSKKKK